MKRTSAGAGLLRVLVLGLLFLTGCVSSLVSPLGNGVDEPSEEALSQISPPDPSQQNSSLTPLGVVSQIKPGQTATGYLDDKGKEGWGDWDWYKLEGISAGTNISVNLSAPALFGVAIWKDGSWGGNWDWIRQGSRSVQIKDTAGFSTWIWVGVWAGSGSYTLSISGRIINEQEVYCLAIVLMSEASIGTTEEKAAVAWTVFNRVSSPRFPNTICEVASSGAYATNQSPRQDILDFARKLIQNPGRDPTGGATHFFSPISMPKEGEENRCRPPVGRGNMDCGGGLRVVPGITKKVYFPSWTLTLTWVGNLPNVRQAYYMFYRS